MEEGSKPWGRSKVMFVGEGRIVESVLCNAVLGKPFSAVESAIGLKQLTCPIAPDSRQNLVDVGAAETELMISLFSFGGQYVFKIICNLFLTFHGVYVVVFDMLDILKETNRKKALHEISFWINAIVIHTRGNESGQIAPVFLVGTQIDEFHDSARHEYISNILVEKFRHNEAWPNVVPNSDLRSCFFQ